MTRLPDRTVVRRPDLAFVLVAYAWSWAWWVPMAALEVTTRAGQAWPSHLPGLLGPAIAAVVVTAASSGRAGLADLGRRTARVRVDWFWYAVLAATAGIGAGVVVLFGLLGQGWPTGADLSTYSLAATMPWFVLVVFVLVINGFGEEIGWRGFLVHRWSPGRGLLRTSLLVAAVWVPWHLPLFWVSESFRSFGLMGAIGWMVSITAGSVVLTWMYVGSGYSIWIVALWHTSFNMVTATPAGAVAAPILSAAVIAAAIVLVRHSTTQSVRRPGRDVGPNSEGRR